MTDGHFMLQGSPQEEDMERDPEYFDCMSDSITGKGGLNWCLKDYHADSYMFANTKESKIKENVLTSASVLDAIEKACEHGNIERNKAEQKAKEIVDEIAHTFNLKTIRFMAFMLSKIIKKLFRHVYVNRAGISKLSEAVKFAPLVLVPSHNSYFDFLLTSLVCFAVDLPLPAIASGQDFLHIAVVNRLLRGSGAFFLRRSFASDHFYRSIFTEYVQQVIKDGRMPMEFFLEGTRSRSGKSLHAKTGMMSMITEMFLLGYVPDVHFCPISISYECITEEQLYLFELLGIPKPKESLTGLLKARKVLSVDYGTAYLHFGRVVSLREFCTGSINRAEYSLFPRHQAAFRSVVHSKTEKKVIREFSELLVNKQQLNMAIFPRSIIAAGVLQHINSVDELQILTSRIGDLLTHLRKRVHGINSRPTHELVNNAVNLCSPVLLIDSENKNVKIQPYEVSILDLEKTALGRILGKSNLLQSTISKVYLSLQRNKLMHALLIPSCIISAGRLCCQEKMELGNLLDNYSRLQKILRPDFVRHPNASAKEDVDYGLNILRKMSSLHVFEEQKSSSVVLCSKDDLLLRFLHGLIEPFIETYWAAAQYMNDNVIFPCQIAPVASKIQLYAASTTRLGILKSSEAMSLATLKNAVLSLIEAGCLHTEKSSNASLNIVGIDKQKLHSYISFLGNLCGLANIWLMSGADGCIKIKAKI